MIMKKNESFIQSSRIKFVDDIIYLNTIKNKKIKLAGIGNTEKNLVLELKLWQIQILEKIEKASALKILTSLKKEKKKLCRGCQLSLNTGDRACDADTKQFIICDMLRRSLTGVHV